MMNTLDYLFGAGTTETFFGSPSPIHRTDADAPPYVDADPIVRAFYSEAAYESIRQAAIYQRAAHSFPTSPGSAGTKT